MNQPTPDPSQEGSQRPSSPYQFPSWEGLGVGSLSQCTVARQRRLFTGHCKPLLSLLLALFGTAAFLLMSSGCRSRIPVGTQEKVGPAGANRVITPVNQVLSPAGIQVELPGMRPQAIALSPDGHILVTSGKTHELIVVNPATGGIAQRVPFPAEKANELNPDAVSSHLLEQDKEAQLSYTGLVFSHDGTRIFLSNANSLYGCYFFTRRKFSVCVLLHDWLRKAWAS